MSGSTAVNIVVFLISVAGVIATFFSIALVGGWLDRRAASERQQAMDDLERYGPLAPGLRTDLLPPDRQADVRAAKKRAGIG